MTEHVPHEADQPAWVAVAQAKGVLSARDGTGFAESSRTLRAGALDSPTGHVPQVLAQSLRLDRTATFPLTRGAGTLADTAAGTERGSFFTEGLDLDEELALHEEMKRRRNDPPDVDAATDAALRAQLLRDSRTPQSSIFPKNRAGIALHHSAGRRSLGVRGQHQQH